VPEVGVALELQPGRKGKHMTKQAESPLRFTSLFDGDFLELIMAPHQQRVVDEKTELDAKLEKLDTFGRTELYQTLPADEQGRLNRQHSVMEEYSRILGERIAAFPVAERLALLHKKSLAVLRWYYRDGGGGNSTMEELMKAAGVTEEWLCRK